ncbi:MAG: hypothetical protein KF824_03360 [Fimbriimonadaceae bacterium]|nr:MAG: hypothetical protein KF824_03360 [Fimbriimonadaceae bacterium]
MNSYRAFCVSALIAVISPAFAVDYQTNGATLGKVIPELAAATELNLTVAPQVVNEVVIIRAKGVEKFDLLQRVADATGLAWIKTDEGYRLDKTNEITLQARQNYANYTQRLVSGDVPNGLIKVDNALDSLSTLISTMPASAISNMDIGGRLVFSTRPTRYQINFPGSSYNSALAEAKAIQQQQVDEFNKRIAARKIDERTQSVLDSLKQPITKVFMVAQRFSFDVYRFELVGLTATGSERISTSRTMSFTSHPEKKSSVDFNSWKVIENSDAKKRLAAFSGSADKNASYESELKAMILNPAENEPAAFAIGPAMIEGAPTQINFVACIPDEEMESIAAGLNLHGFSSLNSSSSLLEVKGDGNWVTIKPELTHLTWATRRNRVQLAKLAQTFERYGVLNLSDKAAYAPYANNFFGKKGWEIQIGARVFSKEFAGELGTFQYSSLEALELYNTLKPRLTGSTTLTLPLSAVNSGWLNYVIFNSTSGPERRSGNRPGGRIALDDLPLIADISGKMEIEIQAATMEKIAIEQNRGQFDNGQVSRERTEFLAGGLPTNGNITVTQGSSQVVVGRSVDRSIQMVLSENELAGMRAAQLSSNVKTKTGLLGNSTNEFGVTRRVYYQFEIRYSDNTTLTRTVTGVIPATSFVPYNKLPSDMLGRIEQSATRMAERANQRNDKTPPPQP